MVAELEPEIKNKFDKREYAAKQTNS